MAKRPATATAPANVIHPTVVTSAALEPVADADAAAPVALLVPEPDCAFNGASVPPTIPFGFLVASLSSALAASENFARVFALSVLGCVSERYCTFSLYTRKK